ncbi:hypothetical protein CsatB_000121 [Cannabis sativa]
MKMIIDDEKKEKTMKMVCEYYYIPKDDIIGEDALFISLLQKELFPTVYNCLLYDFPTVPKTVGYVGVIKMRNLK